MQMQEIKVAMERSSTEQQRWNETLRAMESAAQGNLISGDAVHEWLASWGTPDEVNKSTPGNSEE